MGIATERAGRVTISRARACDGGIFVPRVQICNQSGRVLVVETVAARVRGRHVDCVPARRRGRVRSES